MRVTRTHVALRIGQHALVTNPSNVTWARLASDLEGRSDVPAAQANAGLLRRAAARWSARVDARSSMHDLVFTPPDATYPFASEVRVTWSDDVFAMTLVRNRLVIGGDKCTESTSDAVLAALLVQLVGGEP